MKKLIFLVLLIAVPCFGQGAPPTTLLPGTVGNTGGLALLGGYSVTTSGSTYTLAPNEWWHQGLNIAGTATTIVAPKNIGQAYDVTNSESGSITFGGSTGTVITIAAGATVRVKCSDGANYVQVGSAGGGGSCSPGTAGYLLLSTVGGCANSTADYGLSTSGWYTFPAPFAITDTTLPSQISFTPNSHAAATVAGAASLGVPTPVTTPSVLLLPAAPCTGYLEAATDTSGIMPITCGTPSGISPIVYFVSQQCSGATTTDLTIGLQANGSASTDISTCLAGLMANATPTQPIDVVIDKGYKGHINIPVAGNVTIEGLGGGISNTPITACSIVSNVATLTAKNTMVAGTNVLFSGMSTCTALNVAAGGIAPYFTVLSSGLSATQFEVNITTGNVSGAEAGYASYLEGTGLFAPNGLNNDVINVAPNSTLIPSGQSGLPPQRGANVTIKNLVLNGNRRDGTLGNSTTGDPRGNNSVSWYTDIHIWSMDNVNIDHVVAYNSPSYALLCDNCGHVRVTNSDAVPFLIGQTVSATNQDGWHIDGNSNDIYFSNDYMRTGDDALALNAPEGWCGPITNVTAVNIELHQAQDGGRAYTESAACASGLNPIVSKVSFDNWQGDVNNSAFLFGLETTHTISLNNSITDFTWENSNITAGQGFVVDDSIGNLTFDNVNLRGISNSGAEGFINPIVVTSPISSLTLNNDTLTRTPSGNIAVGAINASTTGTANISTLHIEGFKIVDEGASYGSTSGLLVLNGSTPSTITNANLGLNDYTNISATQIGGTVSNYNNLTIPGINTPNLNVNSGTTNLAAGFYSTATSNLAVNFQNSTSKNWDIIVEGSLGGVHAGEFQFYDFTDLVMPLSLTPTGITATGITVNGATALNGNTSVGGTGGINYGINFGTNFGADAIDLYASGSNKYGWGLNAGEMQFFAQDNTTTHFSFNAASGGLQASGTNEYMRLTPRTSSGSLTLASGMGYCFSSSTTSSASNDVCITHPSTGVVNLPNGTTGTTQSSGDNTTRVATDAFVLANAGGGGSGTVSGQASGVIGLATGSTTTGAQSHINENTSGVDSFTQAIGVNDGTGQGGIFDSTEGTNPTPTAGHDIIYGDSTAHCMEYSANGGGFTCLNGGSSGISGLTAGYIPLAGSATTITANSPLDYGVTTSSVTTLNGGSTSNVFTIKSSATPSTGVSIQNTSGSYEFQMFVAGSTNTNPGSWGLYDYANGHQPITVLANDNVTLTGSVSTPQVNINGGGSRVYICSGGTFAGLLATSSGACTGGSGTATNLYIQ